MRPLAARLAPALALACIAAPLSAQDGTRLPNSFGPVAGIALPFGDFADATSLGWFLGLQGTRDIAVGELIGEIGLTFFGGDTRTVGNIEIETDGTTSVNFSAGWRGRAGQVSLGAMAGFWTEADEFDIVPVIAVQAGRFEIGGRIKGLFNDADWIAVTVALPFRSR